MKIGAGKMAKVFLIAIMSAGFFYMPAKAEQAGHLVISEILFDADGSDAGKEFIELYNPTAINIDLSGWSLKYKKDEFAESQSLAVFSQEADKKLIFKSGFFLVGLNKYEATNYNNVIADAVRTASLPNVEENSAVQKITIILSNKDGIEIDSMSYDKNFIIPAGKSFERKVWQEGGCGSAQGGGEFLGNGCDTDNSSDFEIRNIPNPQNNSSLPESAEENLQTPEPTPSPASNLSPEPGSGEAAGVPSSQLILPVAEAGADREAVIGESIDFDGSDSFDPQGKELILTWDFGDKTNAEGTNVSHVYNAIGEYIVILKADNGGNISEDSLKVKVVAPEFSDKIIISELLPNPAGADKDGEWIELYNFGDKKINLKGWILASGAKLKGKQYIFSGDSFIEAKSFLIVGRNESGMVLTNESGNVSLLWPAEKIISEVSYGSAKEGKSYAFVNNAWQWSDAPTPGKENSAKILTAADSKAKEKIAELADAPKKANSREVYGGESVIEDNIASNSFLAESAFLKLEKNASIEDFLNQLISEKVDKAITKAKAGEAGSQEKILALAEDMQNSEIANKNQEINCQDLCSEIGKDASKDQKNIRNNPWFWGDIALSILSLFLVWRYQEAIKKVKI